MRLSAGVVAGVGRSGGTGEVMLLLVDWQVSWDCGRCSKRGIEAQSSGETQSRAGASKLLNAKCPLSVPCLASLPQDPYTIQVSRYMGRSLTQVPRWPGSLP